MEIPKHISYYARKYSIKKLIHISALGIEKTYKISKYAHSKLEGENIVISNYPNAIIIRPSIVFGNEDKFTNNLKRIIKLAPGFPIINQCNVSLQPIYVEDLAIIFEIGGREKVTLYEILNCIYQCMKIKPRFISMGYTTMKAISFLSLIFKLF